MTATAAPVDAVAAWVHGEPVTVAEVDARLATARSAAAGVRLPHAHTAEGRNARRWIVQLLCAQRLVDDALASHPTPRHPTSRGPGVAQLSIERALALGGVAAAVWTTRPEVDELIGRLCPVEVSDAEVADYLARNADLYADRRGGDTAARADARAELTAAARDRAFAAWLDGAMARDVVLAPGFEHPADPAHPDATHHH